jgi:GR25 family glycosyltransferase involved in LPS biosynthesis
MGNFVNIVSIIIGIVILMCIILSVTNSCNETFESRVKKVYKNYKPTYTQIESFNKLNNLSVKKTVKEMYYNDNENRIKKLIDYVLYINLPHRKDRKIQTINELQILGLPFDRINGVVTDFGGLGCSKAHLNALLHAKSNNFKNVLICEDDIIFKFGRRDLYRYLTEALTYLDNNYDVLMLTGGAGSISKEIPNVKYVRQLKSAQTRTAYLVNSRYYDKLINNFRENIHELETRGPTSYTGTIHDQKYGRGFAGDQYWKRIQPIDEWYIMKPKLCKQRKSYSNIQKRITDYKES